MADSHLLDAPLRPWATGLAGRCPGCGRGAPFATVLLRLLEGWLVAQQLRHRADIVGGGRP